MEIINKNRTPLVLLVIGFVLITAALFVFHKKAPEIQGTWLADGKPLQHFALIDYDGKPFTENQFKGHWTLVFFGYTFCPDVCPVALATLREVMELLEKYKTPLPQVVFVSVDPNRDSRTHLKRYLQYFDKRFLGVTGEQKMLETFARQLGILFVKQGAADSKDYLIDHSASILLISPSARLQAVWAPPQLGLSIADDFRKILESAKP